MPPKKAMTGMRKKLYTVKYQAPGGRPTFSNPGRIQTRGPAKGFTRSQVIAFLIKCGTEKWVVKGILFDNKRIEQEHSMTLNEIAQRWLRIDAFENKISPRFGS